MQVVHEIRTFGDPVLKSRAAPVREFDESLAALAADMLKAMREREGVGLAANQVGVLKRIVVAALEDQEYVLVNPVIAERSEIKEKGPEGCLSIPGIQVEVERPAKIRVSAQDLTGAPVNIESEGLLARIFQHEIDHLDGILILDRTDRKSRKAAMRELRDQLLTGK